MKLSKKQIIIILVGMSVGMAAGVLESISHEYFKPNIDIVGINQSVNTEPKLYIGTKDCNGIAFMNSTGDKICATWNDLHDDIALLKHLNIKNTTTIKWTFTMNSTTTCPDDICQNTTTLTEKTNRPNAYPNGILADVTNKNDCCYYKTTNTKTNALTEGTQVQMQWNGTFPDLIAPEPDMFLNTDLDRYMSISKLIDDSGSGLWAENNNIVCPFNEKNNCKQWYQQENAYITLKSMTPIDSLKFNQSYETNKLLAMNYCINYFKYSDATITEDIDKWVGNCVNDTLEKTK